MSHWTQGLGHEAPGDVGEGPLLLLYDGPVDDPRRQLVLRDAGDVAGVAPDALPQVQDGSPAPLLHGLLEGPPEVLLHD